MNKRYKFIIEKKCIICNIIIPFIKNQRRRSYCKIHNVWKLGLQGRDCIRELIRMRDNHTCQECKKKWIKGTRRFDVHHLDEKCESWDNSYNGKRIKGMMYQNDKQNMDRMITLCHKCHLNLPNVREKMTLNGRNF